MLKRTQSTALLARTRRPPCPACPPVRRLVHSTPPRAATPRRDQLARVEYFQAGVPQRGNPLRDTKNITFDAYKHRRDLDRPADIELDGRIPTTLPSLIKVFAYMKARGTSPSKSAYWALIEAAAEYSRTRQGEDVPWLWEEQAERDLPVSRGGEQGGVAAHERTGLGWKIAWSAWTDARAGGIDLGVRGYETLLEAARPHPHLLPSLLYHAQNTPALYQSLTPTTYDALLRAALAGNRFETVLTLMTEMRMRGMTPAAQRMSDVVRVACQNAAPRVALELAQGYERQAAHGELEQAAWAEILRASAECHYIQGIETAWDRLINVHTDFKPDEGVLLLILNASARHGHPQLATAALAQLARLGIPGAEHHYAPVLEALCARGSLPDALQILDTMRASGGIEPTLATARPLVESMVRPGDIKWVDAGFDALEALQVRGERIDVAAFNAVLKAAEEYGDLKRAVVIYRQAAAFDVVPNVETFNTLLAACVRCNARDQAQLILADMDAQLGGGGSGATARDADTYAHLIDLHTLPASGDMEPAFYWLEEMKSRRLRPALATYEGIARACWSRGDERFRLVLEEMQAGGYRPSRAFLEGLKRGSERGERERTTTARPSRVRGKETKKA
ncbi:hypothetical protein NliqN6_2013 [Naganishia liquefaciens]|uniref:Pentatricopeptide repeat-containing protein-mitochondrial domain-containing protein n=1 Tax=Naganishia liquefaciens TaxID=104408 RepID=A0A8H3TRG8_9TREE|nr:hypothetical protein NliqN6_2013 [Naganishia liquefaciens]